MDPIAAVMTEPGDIAVEQVAVPDPGPDDLTVSVTACGICGTDVHMNEGDLDVSFPVVPGHEFVGRVSGPVLPGRTDARGNRLEEEDLVTVVPGMNCGSCWYCQNVPARPTTCLDRSKYGFCNVDEPPYLGGLSETILVPPEAACYRVPGHLGDLGLLAEPLSVATHALERAYGPSAVSREGFGMGQTVAVHGVGPIGLLAVCAATLAGAGRVIAVDLDAERLDLAREFGADESVHAADPDGDSVVESVEALTPDGVGPDVSVQASGAPAAVEQGLRSLRKAGTLVDFGTTAADPFELDYETIVRKQLDVRGSFAYPPRQFGTALSLLSKHRDRFPFESLLDFHVGLPDVTEAYAAQANGESLRAVVHPNE